MTRPALSVILFAFDEEENIAPVLAELRAFLASYEPSAEIIFVDDGSRDGTSAAAARALAGCPHALLRHDSNRGIGAALKTGANAARGDYVTFLPADGQVPPDAIATLRAASDGADLVLSVYDHRDDGLHRTLLSLGVRALIFALHGIRLRSDGPYLYRRGLLDEAQLPADTFFLNFEFPLRVLRAGLGVRTVEVPCRPRLSGHSKSVGLRRIVGVAEELVDLRRRRLRELVARATG